MKMHKCLSSGPSGREYCEDGDMGHLHGRGTGGQVIMIVLKAKKEMEDLSAIEWALINVAGSGDSVILLGVVNELKKCCAPKLPFRTSFALMCHRICPNMHEISLRKRIMEEQIFRTKENYKIIFRKFLQPCKSREVKLRLEIVPTARRCLRQVAVEQAYACKAEWVILDRQLKKARHYFIKRLPCNLVLMTDTNQGSILKLGPGWKLQRGNCCSEACSADEKSVSGLVLPDLEKDRHHNTSEDSSDYTASGDSDLSSHGGDKNPQMQLQLLSKEKSKELEHELMRITERLPPLIMASREGEISSEEESFYSTSNSPLRSSGLCSPEHETSSFELATAAAANSVGGVLALPLCSACNYKVPDFGPPKMISLEEILDATNNFSSSNHLGDCKLGSLYKGFLHDGQAVSVRRLDMDSDSYLGDADFCSEIEILSLAHHVNVVTLVGFCIDNGERILVFEFACNKALSWHLSPLNQTPLPWSARMRIAVGTARGLRYLHEECRGGSIVHGSGELNSVLVTHDFTPVICNFSQSRLRPHSDRTPVARSTPFGPTTITTKSDVYSFGVWLLELISGGTATDPMGPGQMSIVDSVQRELDIRSTNIPVLLDPDLEGDYDLNELQRMVFAAYHCIQTDSSLRPTMSKVLSILEDDQLEDEAEDQIYAGASSCGLITTNSPFDMVSAGVMVF